MEDKSMIKCIPGDLIQVGTQNVDEGQVTVVTPKRVYFYVRDVEFFCVPEEVTRNKTAEQRAAKLALPKPLTLSEIALFEDLADGSGPLSYSTLRRACDDVKAARSGAYPSDWWAIIMQSGIYDRIMCRIHGL